MKVKVFGFQLKAAIQFKQTHESESDLLSAKSCSLAPFPIFSYNLKFHPLSNFQLKAAIRFKQTQESESVLLSANSCSLSTLSNFQL